MRHFERARSPFTARFGIPATSGCRSQDSVVLLTHASWGYCKWRHLLLFHGVEKTRSFLGTFYRLHRYKQTTLWPKQRLSIYILPPHAPISVHHAVTNRILPVSGRVCFVSRSCKNTTHRIWEHPYFQPRETADTFYIAVILNSVVSFPCVVVK